ncbi:DUF362 domain-containing protein [Candidatus Latescibacterota bacterium]
MSRRARKRLIWTVIYVVVVGLVAFDLVMTHSRRGFISLTRAQASQAAQATVTLSSSQDLSPPLDLDDPDVTYAQVKELVYLALNRDTSDNRLERVIRPTDWVGIKVNIVNAPIIEGGTKKTSFWTGANAPEGSWGAASDLRVTKALIEYLIEYVGPQRITIMEGSGEWAQTGSANYPAKAYDPDGWTVTWDEHDGLSYQGIVDDFNASQSLTTLDITDLNDDGFQLEPVPGGGLQLLDGAAERGWGYEDFIPGLSTTRQDAEGGWYVPSTLMAVDKLIDQPVLKTTSPGITVFMKNYVGVVPMQAPGYGAGPGKGAEIDSKGIMSGYTDLIRIRAPDYNLAAGFWANDGWYGSHYDIHHNVVVAGANIISSEAVAARVMGYNPRDLPQMYYGRDVGLGSYEESDYEVLGGDPSELEFFFPGASFTPSGFQEFVMIGPFDENDIDQNPLGVDEATVTGAPGEDLGGETWWSYAHLPGYPEPYTDMQHFGLGAAQLNGKTMYAFLYIESDEAQNGYLRFGSDGDAKVWVNETLMLDVAGDTYQHYATPVVNLVEGTNTVLVKTVGDAGGGGFALNITNGDRMLTKIRSVVPDDPNLSRPMLIAYGGGATNSPKPSLDWCDVDGALTYTLEYGDDWEFTGATSLTGLTSSFYRFPSAMPDATYYWRVMAHDATSDSAWSATDSFAIIPALERLSLFLLAAAMMGYVIWRAS